MIQGIQDIFKNVLYLHQFINFIWRKKFTLQEEQLPTLTLPFTHPCK